MTGDEDQIPKLEIDVALVRRLVAAQFPQWVHLPITPVERQGWDNRTFRLGVDKSVRLPSAAGYALQVQKEQRWLPELAPLLPLSIPVPLALGLPDKNFPWHWSIYRWLDGDTASLERLDDITEFATTLAHFLVALQKVDPSGGPSPGPHSFWRGGPLAIYEAETRRTIVGLAGAVGTEAATAVWETALAASWKSPPVWFHGDVAAGNLLVREGKLKAVIDFGCSGVGDPACDMVIAWTLLTGESRGAFRQTLAVEAGTWARGRGWALWKALITLAEHIHANSLIADEARRVLNEILADD